MASESKKIEIKVISTFQQGGDFPLFSQKGRQSDPSSPPEPSPPPRPSPSPEPSPEEVRETRKRTDKRWRATPARSALSEGDEESEKGQNAEWRRRRKRLLRARRKSRRRRIQRWKREVRQHEDRVRKALHQKNQLAKLLGEAITDSTGPTAVDSATIGSTAAGSVGTGPTGTGPTGAGPTGAGPANPAGPAGPRPRPGPGPRPGPAGAGAAGAAGSVAAGAMTAVGIAASALLVLAAASSAAAAAIKSMDEIMKALVRSASAFHAPLASTVALTDVARLQEEIHRARTLGPELTRFAQARGELDVAVDRIITEGIKPLLPFITDITEYLATISRGLAVTLGSDEFKKNVHIVLGTLHAISVGMDKTGTSLAAGVAALGPIATLLNLLYMTGKSSAPLITNDILRQQEALLKGAIFPSFPVVPPAPRSTFPVVP